MDLTGMGRTLVTRTTWSRTPTESSQLFMLAPTISAAPVPASIASDAHGVVTFDVLFSQGITIAINSAFDVLEDLEIVGSGQITGAP